MNAAGAVRGVLAIPLVIAAFLLNVYFMWTAKVFEAIQSLRPLADIAQYQMRLAGLTCFGPDTPTNECAITYSGIIHADTCFVDLECLVLLISVTGLAFLIFYHRGKSLETLLRVLQVVSLVLMPLGIEIALFDANEIWLHATTYLGPISNADLLFSSISVFVLTSLMSTSATNLRKIESGIERLQSFRLTKASSAPLSLAVAVGLVVAIVKLLQAYSTRSFDWDSYSFLDNARILSGNVGTFPYDSSRPPVISLLVSGLFYLTRPAISDGYVVSALLFALSGIGCYLLARQVMNRWVAILCALTFMTSPFVYYWAGISLTNVEGAAIGGLGLALLAIACTGRPRLFVVALPMLVVAPFVRYTMALIIPLAIFYLVVNRRNVRLRTRYFALGMLLATLTSAFLYSVWIAHLRFGNLGSLFPAPDVSNPTEYGAFVARLPNALGQGLLGYILLGAALSGVGLVSYSLIARKGTNALLLTLVLWAGLLLGYYSFLWPDKSALSVTRYSTEFVMPLAVIAFYVINKGVESLAEGEHRRLSARPSLPWGKMGAAAVLVSILLAQAASFQAVYAMSASNSVDTPQNLGIVQAAAWVETNVNPTTHILLCTEWTLCWWYLPQYTIIPSDAYQEVVSLAPEVSYILYDASQFGGKALNLNDVVPVWESTVGDYIVYKVGNATALSQTYVPYTVQRGDTLFGLGQEFDVPWQYIAHANNLTAPYELFPDEVLNMPLNNPTCLNFGITLPADDAKANTTYGAPAYVNETGVDPTKRVIIRFDDGYQDQWTNALPILAKYGYHAVFAIIDGYQKTQSECTPYESYQQAYYMNWAEVQWLAQNGNEISDHTWTHADLNTQSLAQLQQEIIYSKQAFIQHGIDPMTLTLPYGDGYGNETVMAYITSNGFSYVYTVEGVENTRQAIFPYSEVNVTWHDVDISHDESLANFESIVNQVGPNSVIGLTFHSVGDDALNDTYETNTANFAADMAYLQQNGFDVILPWQLPGINLSEGQ